MGGFGVGVDLNRRRVYLSSRWSFLHPLAQADGFARFWNGSVLLQGRAVPIVYSEEDTSVWPAEGWAIERG